MSEELTIKEQFVQEIMNYQVSPAPDKDAEYSIRLIVNSKGEILHAFIGGETVEMHDNSPKGLPDMTGWKVYAVPPSSPPGCYFFNGRWYCNY